MEWTKDIDRTMKSLVNPPEKIPRRVHPVAIDRKREKLPAGALMRYPQAMGKSEREGRH